MTDHDNRRASDQKIDALTVTVSNIAEKLDAHINTTREYRVTEESDRRSMKRDIRCLHDGYEANKEVVDASIIEIRTKVDDINLALFAKDEQNKFDQVGLMTTAKNVDKHITVMCNVAKWTWRSVLALAAGITALAGAGKALGMW